MRWLLRGLAALLILALVLVVGLVVLYLITPQRLPAHFDTLGVGRHLEPGRRIAEYKPPVRKATRAYMGAIPAHLSCTGLTQQAFDAVMERVDARVAGLEALWSRYRPDSMVSRLNASVEPSFVVDAETAALLAAARRYGEASGGVLDVTVLPIVELWKEAAEHDQLPSDGEVAGVLAHVGPARWSLAGTTVTREPGVRFDLNAVAEGAMADAALALLREAGCVRAIVELGGDVALHRAPGQPPFRIGVDDPGDPSRLLARLEVHAGAIDTAGDYQRFHTIRGRRYGHIVDPRTARPLDPELSSVTVLAPDALTADAWDTALFALGWQGAQDAIEAHPELEALLVHHDGRVWISKGLEGKVSLVPSDQKR